MDFEHNKFLALWPKIKIVIAEEEKIDDLDTFHFVFFIIFILNFLLLKGQKYFAIDHIWNPERCTF